MTNLARNILGILLLATALSGYAAEVPLGNLRLPGGEVLSNAVAIASTATGINVRHASGVTFVHYRHLPPAMRQRLGYDPAREAAYYRSIAVRRHRETYQKQQEKAKEEREEAIKRREKELARFQTRLDRLASLMVSGGTGFFMTPDGYVMTCEHVIRDHVRYKRSTLKLVWLDQILDAELKAYDKAKDFAILKVKQPDEKEVAERRRQAERRDEIFKPPVTEFPFLPLSREEGAPIGTPVFTIGFPRTKSLGWAPKLAQGTISSVRGMHGEKLDYQVMMPIHGGNSGGPLIDYETGGVVGVIYLGINEEWGVDRYQESFASVSYASKIRPSTATMKKIDGFPYEKLRFVNAGHNADRDRIVDYARRSVVAVLTLLPPRREGIPFDE